MISSFTDRRPPKHKQSAQSYFLSPNSVHFQTGSAACDDNLFHCSQPRPGQLRLGDCSRNHPRTNPTHTPTGQCSFQLISLVSGHILLQCFDNGLWWCIFIPILRTHFSTFFFNFFSFFARNYRKNISRN